MSQPLPREILTPRLRLRAPVSADASVIYASYARDPAVCRYLMWAPHAAERETHAFITSCIEAWDRGERMPYVITLQSRDVAIGMLDARALRTTVAIGYVLARTHWGHGLMPEAIQSISSAALSNIGIFRVQATCDVDNFASQRALEKAGFSREGRLERYSIHPCVAAEPRACFMYAKCR